MVSTAKSYKPAHGGYPATARPPRRLRAGLPGQTPAQAAAGGMIVKPRFDRFPITDAQIAGATAVMLEARRRSR